MLRRLYHATEHLSHASEPPKITPRALRSHAQWLAQDRKTDAVDALSEQISTRNFARDPRRGGPRGLAQRIQLDESFQRICGSCMEVLESKSTTTCTAGRHARQRWDMCSHQGKTREACRVHRERRRIAAQDPLISVPPPGALLHSCAQPRNGQCDFTSASDTSNITQ